MPFHSITPYTMWAIFRLRKLVKVIIEYRLVTVKMMQGTVNCLPPRTQTARARRPVGNPAWRPYSSFLMAVGMWRPAGSPVRRNRSTRRSIRPFHPMAVAPMEIPVWLRLALPVVAGTTTHAARGLRPQAENTTPTATKPNTRQRRQHHTTNDRNRAQGDGAHGPMGRSC